MYGVCMDALGWSGILTICLDAFRLYLLNQSQEVQVRKGDLTSYTNIIISLICQCIIGLCKCTNVRNRSVYGENCVDKNKSKER